MKFVTFEVSLCKQKFQKIGLQVFDLIVDLEKAHRELILEKEDEHLAKRMAELMFPENMIDFFKTGNMGMKAAKRIHGMIKDADKKQLSSLGEKGIVYLLSDVKLLAPVPRPNTIRDFSTFESHQKHVTLQKSGGSVPDIWYQIPVYWKANPDNTIGPDEPIYWPSYTEKLDYELELGIYISKEGKNITAENASEYIAGYTIFNDISARDHQEKEMVMTFGPAKGKDFDNSKIFGPCMVTPDEFEGKQHKMTARINDEVWSEAVAEDMFWTFAQMIAYVSQSETLKPGDFLASGTCPTGCGIEQDRWIKPGDVIELEVEGIGKLRNTVVREEF